MLSEAFRFYRRPGISRLRGHWHHPVHQMGVGGLENMGVVENMRDVADLVKKFNDIELNRRILTLENEVLDLSRERRRAEEKVEELERALRFKAELIFNEPFYWVKGDKVPFCPTCWEGKKE